jgi:hypothetical protein
VTEMRNGIEPFVANVSSSFSAMFQGCGC